MPIEIQQACAKLGIHWNDPDLEGSARRAYRQLAKELHPDKTGADTAGEFNAINEAYHAVKEFAKQPVVAMHPGIQVDMGAWY